MDDYGTAVMGLNHLEKVGDRNEQDPQKAHRRRPGRQIDYDGFTSRAIAGAEGADVIDGTRSSDSLCGGDGPDKIFGRSGPDVLSGGAGTLPNDWDDQIYGGYGNDVIYDGWGADFIDGGPGNDILYPCDDNPNRPQNDKLRRVEIVAAPSLSYCFHNYE